MKTSDKLCLLATALILLVGLSPSPRAQTAAENTVAIFRGSDIAIRNITASSNTGTALWAASASRPDSICFNNSANAVWIGTTSATMDNVEHSNITNGFPVLSSGTFKLDGAMSGAMYVTASPTIASSNIRCLDGITR